MTQLFPIFLTACDSILVTFDILSRVVNKLLTKAVRKYLHVTCSQSVTRLRRYIFVELEKV